MNRQNIFINFLVLLFFITFLFSCGEKKYSIATAPKADSPIADYEGLFTKKQRQELEKISRRVEAEYGVKMYFLSVTSFYPKTLSFARMMQKINDIFNITYEDECTQPIVSFDICSHEKNNSVGTTVEFRKKINEKRWDARYSPYIDKYFPKHQYYKAFKAIFEITEDELRKYKEENSI